MLLPEDWRAFIESLNSNGVEYVVVGLVALAHHGFPRYTGGLDILIRNSPRMPRGWSRRWQRLDLRLLV